MNRSFTQISLTTVFLFLFSGPGSEAKRQMKPWPEINLSTLPSVVGAANSWFFEINQRSVAYLCDLDKMYLSLAYGFGKNDNQIPTRDSRALPNGYPFFGKLDYKIYDLKLNIYSNLGRKTAGSFWVDYGKNQNQENKRSIVASVPSKLFLKSAFSWRLSEKITVGVGGLFSNWPRALVFVLTPKVEPQYTLPADVGENITGEVDLMYRPNQNLDVIFGGLFRSIYTKYVPPLPDYSMGIPNYKDTVKVKEYIYTGAPRFSIKRTLSKGDYLRVGGSYYFNLTDYQYDGSYKYEYPSLESPSYRLQEFQSFIPQWTLYVDGTKTLGTNSALYLGAEMGSYPNDLLRKDTDFAPVRLSLVNLKSIFSGSLHAELSSKLTRIFHGMIGLEMRYFDHGDFQTSAESGDVIDLDDRSFYAAVRLGTTTRFYRNLWWSVRVPTLQLSRSKALGSSILFENRSYVETEILFLGL